LHNLMRHKYVYFCLGRFAFSEYVETSLGIV